MKMAKRQVLRVRATRWGVTITRNIGLLLVALICVRLKAQELSLIAQTPLPLSGRVADLDAAAGIAAVAAGAAGISVYDVVDPHFPKLIGNITNAFGSPLGLSFEDSVAYVAVEKNYSYSLRLADIANPSKPSWMSGSVSLPFPPGKISVDEARLFVFGAGQIRWINAKSVPFEVKDLPVRNATAMSQRDPFSAWVTVPGALQLWDVAVSTNEPQTSIELTNRANDILFAEKLFVATQDEGSTNGAIQIFDVSITPPVVLQKIELDDVPIRLATDTTNIFTLTSKGKIETFAPHDGGTYFHKSTFLADRTYFSSARLRVRGRRLYYSSPAMGVQVFEIDSASGLVRKGQFDTSIEPRALALQSKYAYMAALGGGMLVYDVSSVTNPVLVARAPTPGRAVDVAVAGQRAYVAAEYGGMQMFDISRPENPTLLGNYPTVEAALDVEAIPNGVLLSAGHSGLHVIDTSDPVTPIQVANIAPPRPTDQTFASAVSEGFAVIVNSTTTTLADIRDPSNPVIVTNFPVGGSWVVATNRIAFVNGLYPIDFHDLASIKTPFINPFFDSYGGTLANSYILMRKDGRTAIYDCWDGQLRLAVESHFQTSAVTASSSNLFAASTRALSVYKWSPPPRLRILAPERGAVFRAGDAIRIEWEVDRITNQVWSVAYLSGGYFRAFDDQPQHDSFNHWWLETRIPEDALTTTGGVILIGGDYPIINHTTSVAVEGRPNVQIYLSGSKPYLGWQVVLDNYELLTKTDVAAPWTVVKTNDPVFKMYVGGGGDAIPASERTRFFKVQRVVP